MKTIEWPKNLDANGEYDEHHDFSQVLMVVSEIETIATQRKKYTADIKTLDFGEAASPDEVSHIEFQLGFWANIHAKQKGKRLIKYQEDGQVTFTIDLSEEDLQKSFVELCRNPNNGLAQFVKQCFEADRYETIEES